MKEKNEEIERSRDRCIDIMKGVAKEREAGIGV